jgi:hypothetical protein
MPNEKTIDLFVKLKFGELYLATLKFVIRKRKVVLIGAAFLAVVTGSIIIHANSPDLQDDRWIGVAQNVKPLFNIMWICMALFPVTTLISTWRILRDPRAKNGFKYRVASEGIRVEGSAGTSDYNWTAFIGAREISTAFFLFVTGATFHLIPKRSFATSDDLVQFREIIRASIPRAKLK